MELSRYVAEQQDIKTKPERNGGIDRLKTVKALDMSEREAESAVSYHIDHIKGLNGDTKSALKEFYAKGDLESKKYFAKIIDYERVAIREGKSLYDPDLDMVITSNALLKKNPSVFFHEFAHRLDRYMKISDNPAFMSALDADLRKTLKRLGLSERGIKEAMSGRHTDSPSRDVQEFQEDMFSEFERNKTPGFAAVSDIISGMTMNNIRLTYGHLDEYWKKYRATVTAEAWADILHSLLYKNDRYVIESAVPTALKWAEERLKEQGL
jgi:hypothetical protein